MKKIFIYSILVFLITLLILNPEKSILYAQNGIALCQEIIIPSLFPFFVCSGLLVYSGFCEILSKFFKPIMKPLFNINPTGSAAFILGLVSGYPLGALTACQLHENLYISKSEAERLLAFCNNSGPLFILGAIGVSMYHSPQAGILLYLAHIFGAISVGILFRFYKPTDFNAPQTKVSTKQNTISELFSIVLNNSIQSILTVCASVIFCSVMANLIMDMLTINSTSRALLQSCFEFTSGLLKISNLNISLFERLLMSAGVCAFAGLSVHMQVMGICTKSNLSLKPYIIGKVLHGIFSVLYTFIFLKMFPVTIPTFSTRINSKNFSAIFFISSVYSILTILLIFSIIIIYLTTMIHKKNKSS